MRLKKQGLLRGIKNGFVEAYEDLEKKIILEYDKAYILISFSEDISIKKVKLSEELYKVECDTGEIYVELKMNKVRELY